ncbi:MAG TPA: hypothetical protein VF796_05765 [Humisphaera sp.]
MSRRGGKPSGATKGAARRDDTRDPSTTASPAGTTQPTRGGRFPLGPFLIAGTVAVLALVGATLYAGPAAPLAIPTLLLNLVLLAVWVASALGWGAFPARWLSADRADNRLVTLSSAFGLGLGAMGFAVLFGGLAGMAKPWFGWSVLGVGATLGVAFVARRRATGDAAPVPAEPVDAARWRLLWLAVVPALACVLVAAVVPAGLLWKPSEPHGFDVVEYHFQVPREWLEAGRITPLAHNAFSFFPFAVEMHYLLAMEVAGGAWPAMFLAQLMHAAMVAGAVAAACGFASQHARTRGTAVVATLAIATTPWLALLAPIGFNEGGLLLYGTLTVGFALRGLRGLVEAGGLTAPLRPFVAAGVFAGLACGVKLTAGPLLLAAVPAMLLAVAASRAPRRAFVAAATMGVVGAAVYAPWAVRNVAWCGNPVFPEASAVFGPGHFTEAQVARWQAAHKPPPKLQPLPARLEAFRTEVLTNWQFGYVLLPLGAVGLATAWRARAAWFLAGLVLLHAAFWVGFTHLQGRFFVLAVPLAGLAVAAGRWELLAPRRPAVATAALAAVVLAAAAIGWWPVHRDLLARLHSGPGGGIAGSGVLGNDDLSWAGNVRLQPEIGGTAFPVSDPSAKLLLVGDAEAFYYPLPMSRLRYRTPFDVPAGADADADAVAAYAVGGRQHDEWVIANVDELTRFERTYQPFPAVSDKDRQRARGDGVRVVMLRPGEQ